MGASDPALIGSAVGTNDPALMGDRTHRLQLMREKLLTDFERYYQRIRSQQKRDSLLWSLLLVALYLAAGNVAEFNLINVWQSLPNFFDYIDRKSVV